MKLNLKKKFATNVLFGVSFLGLIYTAIPSAEAVPVAGGTLNPLTIPKYVTPLVIPPEMPTSGQNSYDIEVVQFEQQILPTVDNDGNPLGPTTVWSYAAYGKPETRNYPAFTLEVSKDRPVQIKWRNNLVDSH